MSPPPRRERPEHRPASRGTRERVPTIAILLVALAAAIVTAVVVRDHVDSAARDGPGTAIQVTSSSDNQESSRPEGGATPDYRTPFPPFNNGDGPCHDPRFTLLLTLPAEHVYHTGETMSANVLYDAPGCKTMSGTFGIQHVQGSPRYEFYCRDRTPQPGYEYICESGFGGSIPMRAVDLTSPSGVVTLVAEPGTFPPAEYASVPDLEGAQVCAIVVAVDDGIPDGSSSFQQINVACPEDWY